jgi:hypothetical protein
MREDTVELIQARVAENELALAPGAVLNLYGAAKLL